MPLIPEAIIAMLATVRLGAVHSVVFGGKIFCHIKSPGVDAIRGSKLTWHFPITLKPLGDETWKNISNNAIIFVGFAARELCSRIVHAEPKIIIAASCGVEPNKVIR